MDWFRSHHGAPSDPKWLVIARKAKVAPVVVVSTFWMLLDYASQHQDRGTVTGFDVEVAAAFLGVEDEEVAAVLAVMEERGMIADGRLKSWEKRQKPVFEMPEYHQFRKEVFERDGYACVYCGSQLSLSLDHVIPQSRGGAHTLDNLVTACRRCNSSKGARTPEEWGGCK